MESQLELSNEVFSFEKAIDELIIDLENKVKDRNKKVLLLVGQDTANVITESVNLHKEIFGFKEEMKQNEVRKVNIDGFTVVVVLSSSDKTFKAFHIID